MMLRAFLALVATACGGQRAAPHEPTPVADQQVIVFNRYVCERDTIVETLCGGEPECGRDRRRLAVVPALARPAISRWDAIDGGARDELLPDLLRTAALEQAIIDAPAKFHVEGAPCCYSRCVPIVVGPAGIAQAAPLADDEESCVPAPVNGTRFPDRSEWRCPAAVKLAGFLRPFRAMEGGECCYR
jgi:hypothetical protein